ncbi:MAG: spore coat protein [Clostridiales bacterium GWF2_36_10]|nr:MAG: spore coat protein [Clostridiales bacterium GWF2_36_10]HAN20316.1 spore coat protein [Clostridiales bacterium]
MNSTNKIAPHETFDLHELLTFKNICATKSSTMNAMVNDEELKSILQQDVTVSQQQIRDLESLIKMSEYSTQK